MSPQLFSAQSAMRERRFDDAANICRQVLTAEPRNIQAKMILANCFAATGQRGSAESLFREILQLEPRHFETLIALSSLVSSRGALDEAANFAIQAASVRQNDGLALYQVGFALLGTNHNQQAADTFQRAARLSPNVAEIQHFLGVALQRIGKVHDAAQCFRAAIILNPGAVLSYVELSHIMVSVGDPESAVSNLKKVVELDPNSAKGHFLLARALAETNQFESAQASLSKALELDPTFAQALVLRGRLLQQHGRFEDGEASLRHAISLHPECSDGYYALVNARKINESDRTLIAQINKLVSEGGLSPQDLRPLQYALGKAYDDLGEYEKAMQHFNEANRLSQARLVSLGRVFDSAKLERQVDDIRSQFSFEYLKKANDRGSDSAKPIFIVGMARSGTTLLEQMVSSHSKVAGAGELGSWREMAIFDQATIPTAMQIQEVAHKFLSKIEKFSSTAEHITVKTPQNYFILGQILSVFPNCRILHCQRSPIDTCLSIYTTSFFSGPDFAHELPSLVTAYREYVRVMAHWRQILPSNRFLDVRYEDLVSDREPILRRIVEFLDLEWEDSMLHHEKNDHPISTPSLWQARQPVFTKSVERWRRYEPWLGPLKELQE